MAASTWICLLAVASLASAAIDTEVSKCCQCSNLMPHNRPSGSSPQVDPSPFKIKVNADRYTLDDPVVGEFVR